MKHRKLVAILSGMLVFAGFSATSFAQKAEHEDFDAYKLRIDAGWYYPIPSGSLSASGSTTATGPIDLQKDLGFPTYSTFAGRLDWKFTRKNHLFLAASPFNVAHQTVLARTFTFQGQTFTAGLTSNSTLSMIYLAPGYQYDFIRRKRGHLGLAVQMDLLDMHATIAAAAQIVGGVSHPAVSAAGSLIAPIPVAGPDVRFYLTNSPRLFVQGNVLGMYLFGYGNFVSSTDYLGLTFSKHFAATAGYALGSRVEVNSSANRIGVRFTQKGPIVGLQTSF